MNPRSVMFRTEISKCELRFRKTRPTFEKTRSHIKNEAIPLAHLGIQKFSSRRFHTVSRFSGYPLTANFRNLQLELRDWVLAISFRIYCRYLSNLNFLFGNFFIRSQFSQSLTAGSSVNDRFLISYSKTSLRKYSFETRRIVKQFK